MNFSHETLSLNVFIVRDNKACLFGLKIVFSNPLSLEDNSINASTIVETKILATGSDLFLITFIFNGVGWGEGPESAL